MKQLIVLLIAICLMLVGCGGYDDSFTIRVTGSTFDLAEINTKADALFHNELYVASDKQKAELQEIVDSAKAIPTVKFSGSYMIVTSSGGTSSRSVEGTTPIEYKVKGDIVSCTFQLLDKNAIFLKVEILRGDKVVMSDYTTADYGLVMLATD